MASQLSWSSGTCCKPQLRTLRSLNKWFRTMIISYLVYTSVCRYAHCISELGSVRCLVGTPISRIVVKMFQICPVEICQPCNTDTGYLHVAAIIAIIWIHWFFLFLGFKKGWWVLHWWTNQWIAMAVDSDSESVRVVTPSADFETPVTWNGMERFWAIQSHTFEPWPNPTKYCSGIWSSSLYGEAATSSCRHTQVCACIVIVESYTCAKGFRTDWA